jgi:hypothetical protein
MNYSQTEISKMTEYLQTCARQQKTINYDDAWVVARQYGSFQGPHDKRLWDLLGVVSGLEVEAGRGALSAVVVTKENNRPGHGFFELEKELGRYAKDDETTWIAEIEALFSYWKTH